MVSVCALNSHPDGGSSLSRITNHALIHSVNGGCAGKLINRPNAIVNLEHSMPVMRGLLNQYTTCTLLPRFSLPNRSRNNQGQAKTDWHGSAPATPFSPPPHTHTPEPGVCWWTSHDIFSQLASSQSQKKPRPIVHSSLTCVGLLQFASHLGRRRLHADL